MARNIMNGNIMNKTIIMYDVINEDVVELFQRENTLLHNFILG